MKIFCIGRNYVDHAYEVELVIKISKKGKSIAEEFASDYYNEIGIGIDFTARDLQSELKEKGHPWEISKAFDKSAAISSFVSIKDLKKPDNISFYLKKNGETVQQGYSKDMIFNFNTLISYISQYFTIQIGDLIYTGTPAGVGPIAINEIYTAGIEENELLHCEIK